MPYNFNILFLGKSVDLTEYEAEAVTSLIKLYIRELPENILTSALLPKFNEISGKKKKTCIYTVDMMNLKPILVPLKGNFYKPTVVNQKIQFRTRVVRFFEMNPPIFTEIRFDC